MTGEGEGGVGGVASRHESSGSGWNAGKGGIGLVDDRPHDELPILTFFRAGVQNPASSVVWFG